MSKSIHGISYPVMDQYMSDINNSMTECEKKIWSNLVHCIRKGINLHVQSGQVFDKKGGLVLDDKNQPITKYVEFYVNSTVSYLVNGLGVDPSKVFESLTTFSHKLNIETEDTSSSIIIMVGVIESKDFVSFLFNPVYYDYLSRYVDL